MPLIILMIVVFVLVVLGTLIYRSTQIESKRTMRVNIKSTLDRVMGTYDSATVRYNKLLQNESTDSKKAIGEKDRNIINQYDERIVTSYRQLLYQVNGYTDRTSKRVLKTDTKSLNNLEDTVNKLNSLVTVLEDGKKRDQNG